MADERQKLFPERAILIPRALDWQSLERLDGNDLDQHYRHILVELGKKPGMLGTIFRKISATVDVIFVRRSNELIKLLRCQWLRFLFLFSLDRPEHLGRILFNLV